MSNAPRDRGAAANKEDGQAENSHRLKPLLSETQSLLRAYFAARERCETNRVLGKWIVALRARLRQARADFDRHGTIENENELAAEAERLRLCIWLAKQAREGGKP